jgi:hypothetical protein
MSVDRFFVAVMTRSGSSQVLVEGRRVFSPVTSGTAICWVIGKVPDDALDAKAAMSSVNALVSRYTPVGYGAFACDELEWAAHYKQYAVLPPRL